MLPIGPASGWPDPDNPGTFIPLPGKVLVWTTCDDYRDASETEGYKTYVFDPDDLYAGATFGPPILMQDGGALPNESGIFCSGHTWMLDDAGNAKLLVVGGVEYQILECENAFSGMPCGLRKAYWFDPLASDQDAAWSDEPGDLPDRNWYPSVITYHKPGEARYQPIALGGSGVRPPGAGGCGLTDPPVMVGGEVIQWQYDKWWDFNTTSNAWTARNPDNDDYFWQQYPRTVFLSDGTILSFGSALVCETGQNASNEMNTKAPIQYPGNPSYGGDPIHQIDGLPDGMRTGIDPNSGGVTVGGWYYANVALLHTLDDRSVYRTDVPGYLTEYHRDRVIIHGGSQDGFAEDAASPVSENAISLVKEWDAVQMVLIPKADAPQARVFGNLVILPDGSLLAVGGQKKVAADSAGFWKQTSRFWPGDDPTSLGVWESMADRRPVRNSLFTPRQYHSVALLLQDGSVALMGGRHFKDDEDFPDANSLDSVEIFKPPYMFEVQRLKITGSFIGREMNYETTFTFSVNKPNRVAYACLIGIGSVTHHFDYGQRYVELMATVAGGDVTVWVPHEDMLPEGYYLLYVVEERPLPGGGFVRIPSKKGRFIKVTF